jgi:hypothetical protein
VDKTTDDIADSTITTSLTVALFRFQSKEGMVPKGAR